MWKPETGGWAHETALTLRPVPDEPHARNPDARATRLAAGDLTALADLYDRYGSLVYSAAFRLTGDETTASAATGDAFLSVWREPDLLRGRTAGDGLLTITRSRVQVPGQPTTAPRGK